MGVWGGGGGGGGGVGGGVFRMEADSEPKTRRGGMNINNIPCCENSHNGHDRAMERGNGEEVPGFT